jgi:O-antigen/teichoic acid export membrane protein
MLMALNKPAWLLRLSILGAAVNLAFLVPAVPWGIVAVAGAHSARTCLVAPLYFYAVSRLLGIDWRVYWRQIMPSCIGAVSVIGVVLIARPLLPRWVGPIGMLVSLSILGALAYAIVIYATGPELVRGMRDLVAAVLRPEKPELTLEGAAEEELMRATAIAAKETNPTTTAP